MHIAYCGIRERRMYKERQTKSKTKTKTKTNVNRKLNLNLKLKLETKIPSPLLFSLKKKIEISTAHISKLF